MIRRLRSIVRAEPGDPLAANPGEAFGGWMLGTLAALVCLWLSEYGTHSLLPGVLLGAVLALLGWRHIEWLFWLSPVLVAAVLLQPFAPLAVRGRLGALAYVDMLMIAVAVIALVRAVALRRRPMPRTPLDRLMVALLVLSALSALPLRGSPDAFAALEMCAVGVGVFYATTTVASRLGGSRWVWPAFPLAAGLVGGHALVSSLAGPGTLAASSAFADRAWYCHSGLLNMLACSVPACIGLAIDAGHRGARRAWRVAATLGVLGLIAHLVAERLITHPHGWERLEDPLQFSSIAVGCVTLVTMGRMAWDLSHQRSHERSRWVALSVMFVAMPVLQLGTDVLASPTSLVLLATGGGLIVGTMRALSAQAAPEYEEALPDAVAESEPETLKEAA